MPAPDLSEFVKLSHPRKPACQVGTALEALDVGEKEQLTAALATDRGTITGGAIREWLRTRGQEASNPAISSHRGGTCSCHA